MTMPYRPGEVQRRCACCDELRWPPVCHPCEALLPVDSPAGRAIEALRAEVERRDEYYGLDNWTLREVVEFVAAALAEASEAIAARQQPGSTPTDTTRE